MKFVQPIRDMKKISQIKNVLRGEGNIRDLLMFELGINSALRASDLLRLKVKDLYGVFNVPKESFETKEQKTGKVSRISITPKVNGTLRLYAETYPEVLKIRENFVFFAKKTFPIGSAHIGRIQAWKIINRLCGDVGLSGSHGTHSLRKTFGYQARQNGVGIELVQHRLNHSSLAVTKRYLGITDEELAEACNKLDL